MSMQLAISLAESGKRVLLIDADLRKSVLMGRTKVSQKGTMGPDAFSGRTVYHFGYNLHYEH